jgi:hypothetical protein
MRIQILLGTSKICLFQYKEARNGLVCLLLWRVVLCFLDEKVYDKFLKANFERLTRLIKVCGLLMQTKVYLFWKDLERAIRFSNKI